MKLRFTYLPDEMRGREDAVQQEIVRICPDAKVKIDPAHAVIEVTLHGTVDKTTTAHLIERSVNALGVSITCSGEASFYAPPPIKMPNAPRTVRLSVFIASLIAVILLTAILTLTVMTACSFFIVDTLGTGEQDGEDYADKIALIDRLFEEHSIYDTNGQLLLDEMLKAYVAATGDRYAAYYTAEEFAAILADNRAEAVGIGVMVIDQGDALLVVFVQPDSPAEEAGVAPGDRIVTIGTGEAQVSVERDGYDASIAALTGAVDTVAEFSVQRGDETVSFAVTRKAFTAHSAVGLVSATDKTVGIMRILQFDIETPVQFKAEMNKLITAGCTRFVFDVRGNPGGDLNSITAVLSYFLNKGDTVVTTTHTDGTETVYRAEAIAYEDSYAPCSVSEAEIGMYRGYAMAVLTNKGTASAAELFTAVLKDYQLATIVGETTYGKGVYQNIFNLEYWGYSGGLRLTVGHYNPPISKNYDGVGIEPDEKVLLPEGALEGKHIYLLTEDEDTQLQAAIGATQPQ